MKSEENRRSFWKISNGRQYLYIENWCFIFNTETIEDIGSKIFRVNSWKLVKEIALVNREPAIGLKWPAEGSHYT